MLEADPAEIVGDRQQEVVMVVMLGAEQFDRLLDQPLVRGDLLRHASSSSGRSAATLRVTSSESGILRIWAPASIGEFDQYVVAVTGVGRRGADAARRPSAVATFQPRGTMTSPGPGFART